MKANNIVIDWDEDRNEIKIAQVQLTDLEDAAHLPPGFNVRNKQVDNWMWRSPEAHTQARVNIPSDMFSFGVVVSRRSPLLVVKELLTSVLV